MTDTSGNEPQAQPTRPAGKRPAGRRWPIIVLALCVLGAVVVFLSLAEDTADVEAAKAPARAQLVTVEKVGRGPGGRWRSRHLPKSGPVGRRSFGRRCPAA